MYSPVFWAYCIFLKSVEKVGSSDIHFTDRSSGGCMYSPASALGSLQIPSGGCEVGFDETDFTDRYAGVACAVLFRNALCRTDNSLHMFGFTSS